jgi:hypothetical protein
MKAIISDCGKYRHKLSRHVRDDLPYNHLLFIMLNPSTADATKDDPTIRKCRGFSERLGFSFFEVVNLFDYRATDPKELREVGEPSSQINDSVILEAARNAEMVICAWGTHGALNSRGSIVSRMLTPMPLKCLGITKDGHPRHPLYVPYTQELIPFPKG